MIKSFAKGERAAQYYKNTRAFIRLSHQEQEHAILLMRHELKKLPFYRVSFDEILNTVKVFINPSEH